MPRNAFLAFVHALALAVSLLLAAQSAAAQVVPVAEGRTISSPGSTYGPAEVHETSPDECESHRRTRTPVGPPAPAPSTTHVCGCYFHSPRQAPTRGIPVAGSKGLSRERIVGVPVVHRVFRC